MSGNSLINNHVVYMGPFSFPNGGAAARRILGISKSLKHSGLKVTIVSGQQINEGKEQFEYQGINVISTNERTAEKYPQLLKHLIYFNMGRKSISWLNDLRVKPKAIILYSGYSPYLLRLLPWCKKNNVKIIFDAVEWYEGSSRLNHYLSPYYLNIELAMRYLIPKTKNVITISKFLENYYVKKNCNICYVPPTIDFYDFPFLEISRTNCIRFVYCGTPGHKDLLWTVIQVLGELIQSSTSFEFHIAGMNKEEAECYFSGDLSFCKFYGVLDFNSTIDLVRSCDFTILFRPNNRVSKAGFSTKVVESMACGTPVISNNTGDLSNVISNGDNGYIFDGFTPESLKYNLSKVLKADVDENMRINAFNTAKEHFSYEKYASALNSLISSEII